MPPHCDTKDGPVVIAAKESLEQNNVNLILPWAFEGAEAEIKEAFEKTIAARKYGNEAKEVADTWFFETVVRLHREGEGAPYTGLKPAGLDEGPVVPLVNKAVETENISELTDFIKKAVDDAITEKFTHVMHTKKFDVNDTKAARLYVEKYLGLTLYSHTLYQNIKSGEFGGENHEHKHE